LTTRLLRASLGSPTYEEMRATLRATYTAPALTGRGVTVHAQPLPLFRDEPGGGLGQAVRVAVTGSTAPLVVRLGDRTALVSEGVPVDVWVPEVPAPQSVPLEVADLGTAQVTVTPQRKWTVYVVHHSHLDIGYTDRQGVVLRNHLEYLDSALELAAATDDWPDDAKFRWTVESALPVRRWLAARAEPVVARFTGLARAGRIEVTALPFQLHTEACSVEELHRLLRFTDNLREEYRIPVTSAMHTDVPGAVVGLVDALAAAGVRYLSAAHNWAGRSVPFLHDGQRLGRPFWWRSPAGNRLLVWFTDTPHGMAYMEGNVVGLAESLAATEDLLPGYLDALASRPVPYRHEAFGWSGLTGVELTRPPYPHDLLHLRVQGGNADNAGPSLVPPAVIREWNARYAWPKLRMATNTDFFQAAESSVGERLDEHSGDWTDWWADGLGSGARPLGYARRAQHAVRHAETLHTLAGAGAPAGVDAVYDKLGLFDEHTWGAANPWHDHEDGFDSGGLQWARKCELAYTAADDAEDLRHAGARRLGALYAPASGALTSYLVVNPGAATRTDTVTAFLPSSTVPLEAGITVLDARTGLAVPHHEEPVRPQQWPSRPAGRRLVLTVHDVPACGAVRLDVVAGDGPAPAADLGLTGTVENEFYRVEYDLRAGAISSIFDKRAGRELVNQSAYAGMNQYVYDRYSTIGEANHLSGHIEAGGTHQLALLAGRSLGRRPSLLRAGRTAAGEELTVALDGEGVDWLQTTVTLPAGVPRVDITNRLYKRRSATKESVFFAFPFAAGPPAGWELTGGVGGPDQPTVPGAARHLQPIRHWVSFGQGDLTAGWATLEAPLVMFGDLYLPYSPFPPSVRPEPAEPGTVYSWAMNNIWDTNFPGQQHGETSFRYAVTSGTGQEAAAGLVDPFLAVPLSGPARAPDAHVFAEVSDPRVRVSSLAASRRGHDLVAYLHSGAPSTVETMIRLPYPVRGAYLGTSLERDLQPVPVRDGAAVLTLPPGTLVALALDLGEAA
jgi:glycosyl hydrolase family 38